MGNKKGYFERDRDGNERIVLTTKAGKRSSSDKTTRELLDEANDREQRLISQVSTLQTQLSFAERNEWQLRRQHETLVNEHGYCRNLQGQLDAHVREVERLRDLLDEEEDKTEKLASRNGRLEEKIRSLKRPVVQDYRPMYDEKVAEVEVLRQRLADQAEMIRLADTRLADKNRIILRLKEFLEQRGFRVQI